MGSPAAHYIGLETADGILDHALTTHTGGLVSLIAVEGARSMADWEALQRAIRILDNDLKTRMESAGHSIQLVWNYDPGDSQTLVAHAMSGMYQANREINGGFSTLLDDWSRAVAPWCANENIYVAVTTEGAVLTKTERNRSVRNRREAMRKGAPVADGGQALSSTLESLRDRHDAMLTGVVGAMDAAGLIVRLFRAHDACRIIRSLLDPEFTAPEWRASLPGDPLPMIIDDATAQDLNDKVFVYPDLPSQLMPRAAEIMDIRTVRVGDRLHMPMFMKRPPQHPEPFQRLLSRMLQSPFPWRMSVRIGSGGLSGLWLAESLASVLMFTARENKLFKSAINMLEERQNAGEAIVKLQIEFDTWIHAEVEGAKKYLRTRAARLAAAVQAWGAADVEEVSGDPLMGVTACVPGAMTTTPTKAAAAPLTDAIMMLPITRPGRIWDRGLPYRSPDGKLLPYKDGSRQQASHTSLYVAPMGSGKSVTANIANFAFMLEPGLGELPYLLIVDIGRSSIGLMETLRDELPVDKKHLVSYRRLQMRSEDAINHGDLMLFCHRPTPLQKSALSNFLTQIATPTNSGKPPNGILGLIDACIERAYDDLSPKRHPRLYHRGADGVVDDMVKRLGINVGEDTTYWDLVEAFGEANAFDAAAHAQRLAVPLVSDFGRCARDPEIMSNFGQIVEGNVTLAEFFWRSCVDAVRMYPVLSGPTRFNIGEARAVAVDLDEVAKTGTAAAEHQAALMYMLVRHAGASHFFRQPEDLQYVPEKWRSYHRPILERLRSIPKRIFYDEWHRVSKSTALAQIIATDIHTVEREIRKWNIQMALSSQDMGDYSDFLVDLATTIYILGVGNPAAAKRIATRLELPAGAEAALDTLRAPSRQGAEMVAVFRTSKHRTVVQKLVNTIGPQLRIALDSSPRTADVTRRLKEKVGSQKARLLLAQYYPDGVEEEIERRNYERTQSGITDNVSTVDELVAELIKRATQTA